MTAMTAAAKVLAHFDQSPHMGNTPDELWATMGVGLRDLYLSRAKAALATIESHAEPVAWMYEYQDIYDYWRPAVVLANGNKNAPKTHNSKPIRNVRPLSIYAHSAPEACARGEWRTMESAPKEWKPIIVFDPLLAVDSRVQVAAWNDILGYWQTWFEQCDNPEPTLWMPTPDAMSATLDTAETK